MEDSAKLKAALFAPIPHWPLIVAIGVGPAVLAGTLTREMIAPALVMAIVLQIVVYGRILGQVLPDRAAGFWDILKQYSFDYLVASVFTAAVGIALGLILFRFLQTGFGATYLVSIVRTAAAIVAIYVWPIVFLRHSGLAAIPAGVLYLKRNFGSSLWLVGIVVLENAVLKVGQLVYVEHSSGWSFGIHLLTGAVFAYLSAASFAGALHTVIGAKVVTPQREA